MACVHCLLGQKRQTHIEFRPLLCNYGMQVYLTVFSFSFSFIASAEEPKTCKTLVERLEAGEYILCAEGYLLALCCRGYIAYGLFLPDFLVDCPEVLRPVHYEFVHAGSDVTVAFQVGTK